MWKRPLGAAAPSRKQHSANSNNNNYGKHNGNSPSSPNANLHLLASPRTHHQHRTLNPLSEPDHPPGDHFISFLKRMF